MVTFRKFIAKHGLSIFGTFCFILIVSSILPATASRKKTICVNMIVKNESKVITRCLASVKPIIDYWVIVDTGSSDGTQEIIKNFMKDIPGELHERPWINFGHNRNEALQLAKGKSDYVLIIDADEVLLYDKNFRLPNLDKDFYYITTLHGASEYVRNQLINNTLSWRWVGVLHEYLDCREACRSDLLAGVKNLYGTDGARSKDPKKYKKDAEVLEAALLAEPDNSRYVFYLARSYRDAGEPASALKYFTKRVEMGGWDEEIFWSLLEIGLAQQKLSMPEETVVKSLTDAHTFKPGRAEPLFYLAKYHRTLGNWMEAYLAASKGLTLPLPSNERLFVQKSIYDYDILMEYSIATYWIGKYGESQSASEALLKNPKVPGNVKEIVKNNLVFAIDKQKDNPVLPLK